MNAEKCQAASGQMTIRSLYRHNDTFFSHSVPSEDNHRYACSPPFTLFISPSSTNHTSSKPFVFSSNKRKPTGIQSTTNAHIDEGPPFRLPLSLFFPASSSSPPSSSSYSSCSALLLERPRFRVSFFSSKPIFNLRRHGRALVIAGPE